MLVCFCHNVCHFVIWFVRYNYGWLRSLLVLYVRTLKDNHIKSIGGISEALLTTAFGLVVAVVLQILQNTVLYIIDNKVVSMQKAVNLLMGSIEKLKK